MKFLNEDGIRQLWNDLKIRLGDKLDKSAQAVDSAKLGGKNAEEFLVSGEWVNDMNIPVREDTISSSDYAVINTTGNKIRKVGLSSLGSVMGSFISGISGSKVNASTGNSSYSFIVCASGSQYGIYGVDTNNFVKGLGSFFGSIFGSYLGSVSTPVSVYNDEFVAYQSGVLKRGSLYGLGSVLGSIIGSLISGSHISGLNGSNVVLTNTSNTAATYVVAASGANGVYGVTIENFGGIIGSKLKWAISNPDPSLTYAPKSVVVCTGDNGTNPVAINFQTLARMIKQVV